MNLLKMIFNCLLIVCLSLTTAAATTVCTKTPPHICVEITKTTDKNIPGSFYYTCPVTLNGKVYQEQLSGNCKNNKTCHVLESLYALTLNSTHKLNSVSKNACNTHGS